LQRCRPILEELETRDVPTATPWADGAHLTLSFAPDGTSIAGQPSIFFQTANQQQSATAWEQVILQAFQTWAVNTNLNIGVVTDSGAPFGAPGLTQGDARFGDIRIGAQPLAPDALALTVPNDPTFSGTWTGDMFFNSQAINNQNLDAVALHEAGHALGLDESSDPNSPMYGTLDYQTQLTSQDIANIQALYGQRTPDQNELQRANDSLSNATVINFPSGNYQSDTPLVAFGDVTTTSDVDYFVVKPASNYSGPMSFQLHTAGLSLLNPKLSIYDQSGHLLGQAQSTSSFGDVVTVHLSQVTPGQQYYARVEGATHDVYGIGRYALVTTFDQTLTVSQDTINKVIARRNDALRPDQLDALFRSAGQALINVDNHTDDTLNTAVKLATTPGFAQASHYTAAGSLSDATDVDFYQIRTPQGQHGQTFALTVTVTGITNNPVAPQLSLFDWSNQPVDATILANGNGTYTIQVPNAPENATYSIKVQAAPGTGATGNYALTVLTANQAAPVQTFTQGTVTAAAPVQTYNLYIAQSQLFQFVLSANSATATDAAVQMVIRDAAGNAVFTLTAPAGQTVSAASPLLPPGVYTVTFTVLPGSTGTAPDLTFLLRGDSIVEPIGPLLSDPTLAPQFTSPTNPGVFTYPPDIVSASPFLWYLVPPPPVPAPPPASPSPVVVSPPPPPDPSTSTTAAPPPPSMTC
jgi:hypothetical protein